MPYSTAYATGNRDFRKTICRVGQAPAPAHHWSDVVGLRSAGPTLRIHKPTSRTRANPRSPEVEKSELGGELSSVFLK